MELQQQFSHITRLITEAKHRAFQAVNHELVALYWNIGEYLYLQVSTNTWGKAVVQELANFIAKTEPNVKGFSAQNLWRMKQFYETYKDEPKLSALLREIPWTQHRLIIPCKTSQEREYYLRLVRKERLSKREVLHYNLDAILSVGYRINSKRGKFSFQTQENKPYMLLLMTNGVKGRRKLVNR